MTAVNTEMDSIHLSQAGEVVQHASHDSLETPMYGSGAGSSRVGCRK